MKACRTKDAAIICSTLLCGWNESRQKDKYQNRIRKYVYYTIPGLIYNLSRYTYYIWIYCTPNALITSRRIEGKREKPFVFAEGVFFSSIFLLPSFFFLLPSPFSLLPSSFFLLPSSFFPTSLFSFSFFIIILILRPSLPVHIDDEIFLLADKQTWRRNQTQLLSEGGGGKARQGSQSAKPSFFFSPFPHSSLPLIFFLSGKITCQALF